jgi:hypothetical protein
MKNPLHEEKVLDNLQIYHNETLLLIAADTLFIQYQDLAPQALIEALE